MPFIDFLYVRNSILYEIRSLIGSHSQLGTGVIYVLSFEFWASGEHTRPKLWECNESYFVVSLPATVGTLYMRYNTEVCES